jgi:hypothetical protein
MDPAFPANSAKISTECMLSGMLTGKVTYEKVGN